MDLQYSLSKNNEKIFSVNSIYYHSKYDPLKEAERFIENYKFNLPEPVLIILVEPGFSFVYKYLKNRFPESKIGIIRLFENLIDDFKWDFQLNLQNLNNDLKTVFSDIEVLNSELLIWPSAQNLFKNEIKSIFQIYTDNLQYSKLILTTRQYFEKKWLINSVNYLVYARNYFVINNFNFPIVITASGPSLNNSLNIIKKNRSKIILFALSSSLSVLFANKIIPDAVISTDGGFFANEHIKILEKNTIPLIASCESYISKKILTKNPLILLDYKDGLSSELIKFLNVPVMTGERNGTVSGTALKFCKNITTGPIFFCGLDLTFTKGFQHTQPNILEINDSLFDIRISTKEFRISKREMNKDSLNIYRDWFSSLTDTNNVFRIIENSSSLGKIIDLSYEDFENKLKNYSEDAIFTNNLRKEVFDCNENCKKLNSYFNNIKNDVFYKNIFPGDFLAIKHNPAVSDIYKEKLFEKKIKLDIKIRRIIDDKFSL